MLDISKFGKVASYLQVGSECWISSGLVRLPNISRLGRVLEISRFGKVLNFTRFGGTAGYLQVV